MADDLPAIAIIGGTGRIGPGLALRWAMAGHRVIIGSREAGRAQAAAAEIAAELGGGEGLETDQLDRAEIERRLRNPTAYGALDEGPAPRGMTNRAAAAAADIVVVTVPFAAHDETLNAIRDQVAGKIVVDVTVPLAPPNVRKVQLPPDGAAAVAASRLLGADVRVVAAFQNIAARHLGDRDHVIDCDVLVCGDDAAAREAVIALAEAAGMRGWHAGPMANAAAADALTSVLMSINRTYGIEGAGIRITGTPKGEPEGGG